MEQNFEKGLRGYLAQQFDRVLVLGRPEAGADNKTFWSFERLRGQLSNGTSVQELQKSGQLADLRRTFPGYADGYLVMQHDRQKRKDWTREEHGLDWNVRMAGGGEYIGLLPRAHAVHAAATDVVAPIIEGLAAGTMQTRQMPSEIANNLEPGLIANSCGYSDQWRGMKATDFDGARSATALAGSVLQDRLDHFERTGGVIPDRLSDVLYHPTSRYTFPRKQNLETAFVEAVGYVALLTLPAENQDNVTKVVERERAFLAGQQHLAAA